MPNTQQTHDLGTGNPFPDRSMERVYQEYNQFVSWYPHLDIDASEDPDPPVIIATVEMTGNRLLFFTFYGNACVLINLLNQNPESSEYEFNIKSKLKKQSIDKILTDIGLMV